MELTLKNFTLPPSMKSPSESIKPWCFELPLVAGAGGKADQRRSPVAVHDDAHVHAQARRMPAVIFAFHVVRKYASSARRAGNHGSQDV